MLLGPRSGQHLVTGGTGVSSFRISFPNTRNSIPHRQLLPLLLVGLHVEATTSNRTAHF